MQLTLHTWLISLLQLYFDKDLLQKEISYPSMISLKIEIMKTFVVHFSFKKFNSTNDVFSEICIELHISKKIRKKD